jgi:flavin-dependent dehydrogenase
LHQTLVRRAEEAGVELRWGVKASGLGAGVETDQGPFEARWIVGADGLRSQVRRWAGLEAGEASFRRFGVRRHFAIAPWSDFVEVYWGPGCEAYVTPVAVDEVGIALLWSEGKAGFDDLLDRFPALRARIANASPSSRDRGTGPLHQRVRGVRCGNVALVGDAAGYLDAITGEGLAVALHESAALVEAIMAGDLSRYESTHRRINRLPNFMTGLVLALERRPRLRNRAVRALAAEPALFSLLLGIHARTLPPRRLGVDGVLRLAWRLAAA